MNMGVALRAFQVLARLVIIQMSVGQTFAQQGF
jgi:hypothetical protein